MKSLHPSSCHLAAVTATALYLTICQISAQTNNGSFEVIGTGGPADADAWTEQPGIQTRSSEAARTGSASIKSVGLDANSFPNTGQIINVSGLAGRTYVAGLWAMTPSANPITTGGARLKLIFRDASNVQISSVDPLFFTTASGTNVWRKGIQTGTIPAGAATVTFQAMHEVGTGTGTTLYLDDASFDVTDANLPTDGGFEIEGNSTADSQFWAEQGGGIHTRSNEAARSGSWSLKSSSAAINSFPNTSQNINVSALRGRGVTATLWAMTPTASPILSGGARIKIEFFNGATSLGSGETANFVGSSSTKDTWHQGKLELVVPPTATTLRFQAMHAVGGTGGGTLYFDDALLTFLPAGTPANGGFEIADASPTDAAFWGEAAGVSSRSNEVARSGAWSMKSVGTPANGFPASNQEMLVSGYIGETFTAKLWALTPSANPIISGGARLKISFRNSANAEILAFDPVFLNSSSPQNTWIEGRVTGTIPTGAVRVRFQVMHDVGNTTGRTLYFDDASFSIGTQDPFSAWAANSGLGSGQNAPSDDPDQDGTTNLVEFALNGNPLSSTSQGTLLSTHADSNSNSTPDLTLTIAVRAGATFSPGPNGSQTTSIDGVTYHIQGSLDLVSFEEQVDFVSESASGNPQYELHTFRLTASDNSLPAPRGFLRVQLSQP
jgi:hypothetical protein